VDAPPREISIIQTVATAKDFELLVLFTSSACLRVDLWEIFMPVTLCVEEFREGSLSPFVSDGRGERQSNYRGRTCILTL
jgi:hypothetical protein